MADGKLTIVSEVIAQWCKVLCASYGPREQARYAQEFYTTVKTSYVLA